MRTPSINSSTSKVASLFNKTRYDYSDQELREWIDKLATAAPRLTDVHLIFNNCHSLNGPNNARRMAELINAEAPALCVVEPLAAALPHQGTLFDG